MNIQRLSKDRYDESMALWRYCFQDSEAFTEYYYDRRAHDVLYVGGRKIDAQMTVAPYEVNVRGREKRCAMLAGISTRPEMRMKGVMGELLKGSIRVLREEGAAFASLYPFDYGFYGQYGFSTVNDRMVVTADISRLSAHAFGGEFEFVSRPGARTSEFVSAYHRAFGGYSGIALRDEDAFETRLQELYLDGGYACLYRRAGEAEGYLLYHIDSKSIVVHEFCAATDPARRDMLSYLRAHSSTAETVKWICPADDPAFRLLSDPRGAAVIEPFAMARIVDLPRALSGLPAEKTARIVAVSDPFAPWNEGTWRFFESGGYLAVEKCAEKPDFSISIGELVQAAFGYAPLSGLLPVIKTFQFEAY